MGMLNVGRDEIPKALAGTGTAYNAGQGHLCMGDSTTAYNASQTNLQAATNKWREPFDGAPNVSSNVFTAIATVLGPDANFSWQEFGMANHLTAGTMFNRLVSNQGTKSVGAVWQLTMQITFTIG